MFRSGAGATRSLAGSWLCAGLLGCAAEASAPQPGLVDGGSSGTGGSGGGSGGSGGRASGGAGGYWGEGTNGEFCGNSARCTAGLVNGIQGVSCRYYSTTCELGCRTDRPERQYVSLDPGRSDYPTEATSATARALCEEYRLANGPRRPGDACVREYDCLPGIDAVSTSDEPVTALLKCIAGTCQEAAPSTPADYGARCTHETNPVQEYDWLVPKAFPGSCESSLCLDYTTTEGTAVNRCTMQCRTDSDCPTGEACGGAGIGLPRDVLRRDEVLVCMPRCLVDPSCGIPRDAGVPDAAAIADAAPSDAGGSE